MCNGQRKDRGAAAVEMALVLPILVLLVFGIIDFGRLLNAQISITEAAREGARAATIDTADPAGAAQDRVSRVNPIFDVDDAASAYCPIGATAAANTTVVVTYDFEFLTFVGSDMTLTGTGVMPCRA